MTSEPRGAAVALLLSAGAACVGYAPGLEVAESYEAAPMTLAVLTDDGGRVQRDTAELAIEARELVPCDAWTAALGALGPARAWAHGVVEGESAGGVRLDVLHDGGTSVAAGVLQLTFVLALVPAADALVVPPLPSYGHAPPTAHVPAPVPPAALPALARTAPPAPASPSVQ